MFPPTSIRTAASYRAWTIYAHSAQLTLSTQALLHNTFQAMFTLENTRGGGIRYHKGDQIPSANTR